MRRTEIAVVMEKVRARCVHTWLGNRRKRLCYSKEQPPR